jgi:hypothetical protein
MGVVQFIHLPIPPKSYKSVRVMKRDHGVRQDKFPARFPMPDRGPWIPPANGYDIVEFAWKYLIKINLLKD